MTRNRSPNRDDFLALRLALRAAEGTRHITYAMCGLKAVADTLQWIDAEVGRQVATGRWVLTEAGKNLPVTVEFVFEAGDEGAGELGEQLRKEQPWSHREPTAMV